MIRSAYAAGVEGDLDAVMTHFTETPHFSMAGSVAASPRPLAGMGAAAEMPVS